MPAESRLPNDPAPLWASAASARAPTSEPILPSAGGPAGGEAELPSDRDADRPHEVPQRPHAEPARSADAESARAERIRQATASGSLRGAVPAHYEQEDWETVKSANPFEVLYLDYRQPGAISPAVLDERRGTLYAFWKQKDDARSRGGGTQRDRIEGLYGREVGTFPRRIEGAYRRLSEPGGLTREAERLDTARREAGVTRLSFSVESCLADGVLSPEETAMLLRQGRSVGLSTAETAGYLARVLNERAFSPSTTPHGDALGDVLLSTEWLNAERRAREEAAAAARAAAAVRANADAEEAARRAAAGARVPLRFSHGVAHTLDQLADLCDQYPKEARAYLASEAIERWLGAVGEAGTLIAARARRRAHADSPARALELFVRDLGRTVGRPSAPVLIPAPAECVLGLLPMGARAAVRIAFERHDRPLAWGTVRVAPALAGVSVPRTFADDPDGAPASVEVSVDTTYTPAGDYATEVVVEPEGGAPVRVPLRYTVVPLALTPDRPALDLGMIPLGHSRSAAVRVRVSPPGGRLVGVVSLAEPRDGVVLEGAVREHEGTAQLSVDSRRVGPDVQYRSEVRFETNAGVVRVPVSFRVRRASTEIKLWMGSLAAAGGAGMWAARTLLLPGDGWHLSYSWASHGTSVVLAGALMSAVGLAASSVLRRFRKP